MNERFLELCLPVLRLFRLVCHDECHGARVLAVFVGDCHRVRGGILLLDVVDLQHVLTRRLVEVDASLSIVRQFSPLALRPFDLRLWLAVNATTEDCSVTCCRNPVDVNFTSDVLNDTRTNFSLFSNHPK